MSGPRHVALRDSLRWLRASRLGIAALTVLCALFAGALSRAKTPVYLGQAQLAFQEESESNAESGVIVVQPRTAAELAALYPEWERFAAMRERLDPTGLFANDYTDRVLGRVAVPVSA